MKLKHQSADDPITRAFIGHAMKVHSAIGPGLDEEIYHQELVAAVTAAGISHLSKPRRDLVYRGIVADTFEPDFVVENHFIPKLKCLRGPFAPEHLVQVFCYCKFWRLRTSLLVDFGKQSLVWDRFAYSSHSASLPDVKPPGFVTNPSLASRIIQAVHECLNEIGPGYRQTTWKGLVSAAIQAAAIKVHLNPSATVLNHAHITMPSLVIDDTCAVLSLPSPTAYLLWIAPHSKPTFAGSTSIGALFFTLAKPPLTTRSSNTQRRNLPQIQECPQVISEDLHYPKKKSVGLPESVGNQKTSYL